MTEQPLLQRGTRRLVPDWLEEAAVLAGREMFALAVTGRDSQHAELEAARQQWDRAGEDSRVGRAKPGYIDRGRTVILACAGPFLTQIEERNEELEQLRAGRGHYPRRQS